LGSRLGRNRRRLLDAKLAAFAPPGPDRAFEICRVDHDAKEPVLANGIVRRAHFERHLVVGANIDRLNIAPGAKIPEMDPMAILIREQIFRDDPVSRTAVAAPTRLSPCNRAASSTRNHSAGSGARDRFPSGRGYQTSRSP